MSQEADTRETRKKTWDQLLCSLGTALKTVITRRDFVVDVRGTDYKRSCSILVGTRTGVKVMVVNHL